MYFSKNVSLKYPFYDVVSKLLAPKLKRQSEYAHLTVKGFAID